MQNQEGPSKFCDVTCPDNVGHGKCVVSECIGLKLLAIEFRSWMHASNSKTFKTANDRAVQGSVAKGNEAEQKHRKNSKTLPHIQ